LGFGFDFLVAGLRLGVTVLRVAAASRFRGISASLDPLGDDWRIPCDDTPRRYEDQICTFLQQKRKLKPTPGFEPGTPSLRVKCSTS
jgi:hypothetical protein